MIRTLIVPLVSLFVSLFAPAPAFAPPPGAMQDPGAAPGAEHARLGKLAGDWTVVTKFDFGPGAPPQEFRGQAHGKAILGGRFVQFDETAVEFGQPVERQKTWGFNRGSGQYESTWRYTGSTAAMNLVGTSADGGRTIAGDASFEGEKRELQKFTWKLDVIDADHFSSTLTSPAHDGRPAATFAAVYTRAAKK
jgi:hypothetical protein